MFNPSPDDLKEWLPIWLMACTCPDETQLGMDILIF